MTHIELDNDSACQGLVVRVESMSIKPTEQSFSSLKGVSTRFDYSFKDGQKSFREDLDAGLLRTWLKGRINSYSLDAFHSASHASHRWVYARRARWVGKKGRQFGLS